MSQTVAERVARLERQYKELYDEASKLGVDLVPLGSVVATIQRIMKIIARHDGIDTEDEDE